MPALDTGLDYAWSHPPVSAILAGRYRFVLRYLSYSSSGDKVIDAGELAALRAAGLAVGLNWEHTATDALDGASGGHTDATEAVQLAQGLGYPRGCTVFFSVDFNATTAQIGGPVRDYLGAAGAVVRGAGYRLGVYGGLAVIKHALDYRWITGADAWQTFAWSDGQWDQRAAIRQVQNGITVAGADCDRNERWGATHLMEAITMSVPLEDQQSYKDLVARVAQDLALDTTAQAKVEAILSQAQTNGSGISEIKLALAALQVPTVEPIDYDKLATALLAAGLAPQLATAFSTHVEIV